MNRPIGSWPGHCVLASDSLTTATCGAFGSIGWFEESPANQRDAHRREVVLARDAVARVAEACFGFRGNAPVVVKRGHFVRPAHLDESAVWKESVAEWKRAHETDMLDTGQLAEPREDLALGVGAASSRLRIAHERPHEIEDEGIRGAVARVDGEDVQEAARQQPGADEQHHRQRNLRNHEPLTCSLAAAAAHRPLSFAERLAQRGWRRAERGQKTEEASRHEGDNEGKGQHPGVNADVSDARNVGGLEHGERLDAGERDADAHRARGNRQHESLGEQLPRDSSAPGADGEPERQFPLASGRAREIQIRYVEAGNDQQQIAAPKRSSSNGFDVPVSESRSGAAAASDIHVPSP